MPRNPLAKESFLEGTRQKWFAVLLLFMVVILICESYFRINSEPYLQFLTATGCIFIIGASADAVFKIKAADKQQQSEPSCPPNEEHC